MVFLAMILQPVCVYVVVHTPIAQHNYVPVKADIVKIGNS